MSNRILFEIQDQIAIIRLNDPETLNALSASMLEELNQTIDRFSHDTQLRIAIITGTDRSFVAGANIESMSGMDYEQAKEFGRLGASVFRRIETCPKPIIAAINGFALGGGCELALACDFRIASEAAKFGQPEVGLGITPGFSGTQRLSRVVGLGRACELIYTGRIIGAEEALRIGLVNQTTSKEDLIPVSMSIAQIIAAQAPIAVRNAKRAINDGWDLSIEDGIELEVELFAQCFRTEDQKAGMAAFLRKEKITYTGK